MSRELLPIEQSRADKEIAAKVEALLRRCAGLGYSGVVAFGKIEPGAKQARSIVATVGSDKNPDLVHKLALAACEAASEDATPEPEDERRGGTSG